MICIILIEPNIGIFLNGFAETILKSFYTDYDIWSYDLSTNEWEKLDVTGINFHPLFEHNELLYFYDPSDLWLKSYNPTTQEIQQIVEIFLPTFSNTFSDILQNTDWEFIDENRVMVLRHEMRTSEDGLKFIEEVGVVDLTAQTITLIDYPQGNQVVNIRVLENSLFLHTYQDTYKYEDETWELQNSLYSYSFFLYDKLISRIEGRMYAVQENNVGEIFGWK